MLRMGRKRGLLLVWLVMFLLLAVPLYGQSILTQAVSGTGFIVSSDGYIITNRHVINGATKISVTIGNKEYEATVVDSLSDNDIALLKVDAHGLPVVVLGDSDNVQIGDTVYAIGCPAGVCGTITQGRVANLGISSKTDEGTALHNLIMSDLTTTHGSSGGPLLNDKGEVIGITTAGIVVQGETTGFGVSIPINQAIPLLRQVPGFSTSQMGNATTVLSLDGIRRSVVPDTVFVQAEIQQPLSDLLPRQALGRSLVAPEGSGITLATESLWNALQEAGIDMNGVGEAYNKTVSGDTTEEITIDIFDCASATDASRALTYLSAPTTWDLTDPRSRFLPLSLLSWEEQAQFTGTWAGPSRNKAYIISSDSELSSGVTINRMLAYYTYPEPPYPYDAGCISRTAPTDKITPFLELWGFGSFAINDLAFLTVYHSSLRGPEFASCSASSTPGGGTMWFSISYEWKRIGHFLIFADYYKGSPLFRVDSGAFLNNFDQILATVFHTLSSQ